MCPDYYRLYSRLVSVCRQLTALDGDDEECAAIASREREDEARREAVEAVRAHTKGCKKCHIGIIES